MTDKAKATKLTKAEVAKLVHSLAPAAKKCKQSFAAGTAAHATATEAILDSKEKLLQLHKLSGHKQGKSGDRFDTGDKLQLWPEYVSDSWGVTVQHMNRVLGIAKPPKDKVDDEKKPLYIKGHKAGIAEATSPDFEAEMKQQYNKRDEQRIRAARDAFTDTTFVHSFARQLNALLDAIENATEPVSIYLHDLAGKVRAAFIESSAISLQELKNSEESHQPPPEVKSFPPPLEQPADELPAPTKPAKCSVHGCKKNVLGSHRPEHNITHNGKCAKHGGSEHKIVDDPAIPPEVAARVAEIDGDDTLPNVPASFCTGSSIADLIRESGDQF